jgi:hypothetical protein
MTEDVAAIERDGVTLRDVAYEPRRRPVLLVAVPLPAGLDVALVLDPH